MKNKTIQLSILALLITAITFSSCKKNPQPAPIAEQEEFDNVRLDYILINEDDTETTDTTTINFNKEGVPSPSIMEVQKGRSYRSLITISYKGNSINPEITEEGDEHQFFFLPTKENVIKQYTYKDSDKDNHGIGLDGIISFYETGGETGLRIILRHGLNKSHPSVDQFWNSPNYQDAGGADDLNIQFEIHAE